MVHPKQTMLAGAPEIQWNTGDILPTASLKSVLQQTADQTHRLIGAEMARDRRMIVEKNGTIPRLSIRQ